MWSAFRSGTRVWLLLLLLAVQLVGVPNASAQAVPAGYGIRLLDAPTERRADPRAALYVVDHVQPGSSFTRRFEVSNGTDQPARLELYAAAADTRGGRFTARDGRAANELTAWTTVSPSSVQLAPGQTAIGAVTVEVPVGVTDGERYAAVLLQAPSAVEENGLVVTNRVGIRMYVSVGEGPEPASDFVVDTLTAGRAGGGSPVVLAEVENTGQRALDMSGTLTLAEGPGGTTAGPFVATLGTTLGVGDRAPVETLLAPGLPDGPWLATLTLRSGTLERQATATLTFPDQAGTSAAPVAAENLPLGEDPSVVVPVAAGLLGLAALLLLLLCRRRPEERVEDEAERDERLLEPAG